MQQNQSFGDIYKKSSFMYGILNEMKPRIRFCWECGRKLWGNHYVEMEIDGHKRILHKTCGKLYQPRKKKRPLKKKDK